jgi:amino acid transporter
MNRLQIPVLPSIVNAAILLSLVSTANSFAFGASRALFGLALKRQAPAILTRTNRNGVPYVAYLVTLAAGCLAFMAVSAGTVRVLNWWVALVGSAQMITWTACAM